MCVLHKTHGLGVLPEMYSSTKLSMIDSPNSSLKSKILCGKPKSTATFLASFIESKLQHPVSFFLPLL